MRKKVLLVIGGSSDIGIRLIRELADEYWKIWLHYNSSEDRAEELKKEFGEKILPVSCDLRDYDSVEAMTNLIYGSGCPPDHIVQLAFPRVSNRKFQKHKWEEYQEGIDVGVRSLVQVLRHAMPDMAKKHYGKVVIMLTSYVKDIPKYVTPYVVGKYALLGLANSLAVEYCSKGITVNLVSPEMIETRFLQNLPELIVQSNAEKNPLHRNLTESDVIPAFRYFLSDGADAVTGTNLFVTGGRNL